MRILTTALALLTVIATPAFAGKIIGAKSAVINSGGPGFGSINDTFNQSGLSSSYISGVTDFDAYLASNPLHTVTFSGYEWFSQLGSTSAVVTYDLGSMFTVGALSLWNEESSGIGMLNLSSSIDGISFNSLGMFTPKDNSITDSYSSEVFGFAGTDARFIRFDMSGCPQQPSTFNACAIGEVAFNSLEPGAVPEASTWAMMIVGMGAVGYAMRRRIKVSEVNFTNHVRAIAGS